jgi:hypothetical protein
MARRMMLIDRSNDLPSHRLFCEQTRKRASEVHPEGILSKGILSASACRSLYQIRLDHLHSAGETVPTRTGELRSR